MAAVLTEAATIHCVHAGSVQLGASQQRLTAGGAPVLVGEDLASRTISGCKLTGPGTVPCKKTLSMLTGAATRLAVGDRPVLLDTAGGATDSTPPGTWRVIDPGQTTLQAD